VVYSSARSSFFHNTSDSLHLTIVARLENPTTVCTAAMPVSTIGSYSDYEYMYGYCFTRELWTAALGEGGGQCFKSIVNILSMLLRGVFYVHAVWQVC
jgi:hypothetical protein